MRLYHLAEAKDIPEVVNRMFEIAQHNPELKKIVDNVLADSRLDEEAIMRAGFTFGASFALSEFMQGNIREGFTMDKDQEKRLLAYENERLREWVKELEAFIKTTTADTMPNSVWGKLKARLLSKRPDFL